MAIKYSKKAQLRQWWKLFKQKIKWHGFFGAVWSEIYLLKPFIWIEKFRWYLIYLIGPYNRINVKTLSREYVGRDELMLHANFQLLTDFVEKDRSFPEGDWVDPENPHFEKAGKEIKELYVWWKTIRPNRVDPYDSITEPRRSVDDMFEDEPHSVDKDGDPTSYTMKPHSEKYHAQLAEAMKIEDGYTREDQEKLLILVAHRIYLNI